MEMESPILKLFSQSGIACYTAIEDDENDETIIAKYRFILFDDFIIDTEGLKDLENFIVKTGIEIKEAHCLVDKDFIEIWIYKEV